MSMRLIGSHAARWGMLALGTLTAVVSAIWQMDAGDASEHRPASAAQAFALPAVEHRVPDPAAAAAVPVRPSPATAKVVLRLTLVGVSVAGSLRAAWVRSGTDGQVQKIRVGDPVDGLVVSAIQSERLVLVRPTDDGRAEQTISIDLARPTVAISAPAAAASRSVIPPSNVPSTVHYFEPEVVVEGH